MTKDNEYKLDPENMPKTLADLFAGFQPSGRRAEAIMRIGTAWDQMTAQQRVEFFPKTAVSKDNWGKSWHELVVDNDDQAVYEQSLVNVFGDHKTPFN